MKRKTKKRKKTSKGKIFVTLVFITGVAMTVAANSSTWSGFHARTIENKIEKLKEENKRLEIKATTLKSLQNLTNAIQANSSMIEVEDLKHIIPSKEAQNQSVRIQSNP